MCGNEQTASARFNTLCALALTVRESGQPKGVQMYIGGGALLLIIVLVLFFL
jgi:hypothetical protein